VGTGERVRRWAVIVTPNISLSKTERVMQAFNLIWQCRPELNGRYSETVASGLGALIRSVACSVSMSISASDPKAAPLVREPVGLSSVYFDPDKFVELADEDW
jgi:hypothetical protein